MPTFPLSWTEPLDTLVNTTLNTYTSDAAWAVNDNGEKLLKKMAERGRVFSEINDADMVEHPLIVGSDTNWDYYRGSREAFASGNGLQYAEGTLATTQQAPFTMARSSIQDIAANLVVPEDILQRPVQKQMDVVEALVQRQLKQFFREQESYLVTGNATAAAAAVNLAPSVVDTAFGGGTDYNIPSFSLLGLVLEGCGQTSSNNYATEAATSRTFMGVSTASGLEEWAPYGDYVDDGAKVSLDTNGQTVYEYLQKYIIQVSRYGMDEMVTDWIVTPEMYEEVLVYLRSKSDINDSVLANLAAATEIPVAGTMLDFHHFLQNDASWDIGSQTSAEAVHPIIGLNMNSLRLNMVYGSADEQGWLKPISDFLPVDTSTNFFKRLHARCCFSLDNGRRSFVYSDRFKNA